MQAGLESTGQRLNGLGSWRHRARCGTRFPGRLGIYIPLSYIPRVIWKDKPRFETGSS
jgi:hypothetical protein